jgi:hypothetical protein
MFELFLTTAFGKPGFRLWVEGGLGTRLFSAENRQGDFRPKVATTRVHPILGFCQEIPDMTKLHFKRKWSHTMSLAGFNSLVANFS